MDSNSGKIKITPEISIPYRELELSFIRASGPGGQHVNKVSTAVQLRYNLNKAESLPENVRRRLQEVAASYLSDENVIIITAREHRSQHMNHKAAVQRLTGLIQKAARPGKIRRKTRPPAKAKRKRLKNKRKRSEIKKLRGRVDDNGE
ncbi:MAG: alternative ribosome rescue aminoacyl-tRNA hydrolase ArfB [Calditrichia bacterium]